MIPFFYIKLGLYQMMKKNLYGPLISLRTSSK